jgi:hypothetical protein
VEGRDKDKTKKKNQGEGVGRGSRGGGSSFVGHVCGDLGVGPREKKERERKKRMVLFVSFFLSFFLVRCVGPPSLPIRNYHHRDSNPI